LSSRSRGGLVWRFAVAAIAGLTVTWLLVSGTGAQQSCSPNYPFCQYQTQTATAGGSSNAPSATPTNTTVSASPTATNTVAAATATATQVPGTVTTPAPANSAVILGGRGRLTNVRSNGFTVVWWTDAESTGQVQFGTSASLGSTASDTRGSSTSSQTHNVDVTGLQPNTTYFFDVQSGGTTDNNQGQHYQVKTGPDLPSPPLNNALVGSVLNPGGGSPAGGALIWVTVRDGNGQGSTGASQIISTIAGADGRFRLPLQPRLADLSAYFVYQNEGDFIDLFGRTGTGEVSGTVNTNITQDGGTAPAEARLVLAQAAATATATPANQTAQSPTPSPTATAVAASPTAPATATPAPGAVLPTVAPAPTAATGPAVQLPPLKEMLLAQLGLTPAPAVPAAPGAYPQPAPANPAGAPPAVAPVGAAQPTVPIVQPAAPVGQPNVPLVATPQPGAPAKPGAPALTAPPTSGGPALAPQPAPPVVTTPFAGQVAPIPTVVAVASPPPSGLAAMPAPVSALFYAGIVLVALGCGVAVYSLLNGPDWRPR
jgi:hypothetical protein